MINLDQAINNQWRQSTKKATREGFGDALIELAQTNSQIVVLTADLKESVKVEQFAQKFPTRFIECGIAEQNMMGMSAGLASTGFIPICTSYAAFQPGRNLDQLRTSVCYSNANVKVVGSHAGLSVGPDGATHQALEDIAITQSLPNLTVISPCDYEQAKQATKAMINLHGPVYLRLSREPSYSITSSQTSFEIGKAQTLRFGSSVTIIATGILLAEALHAADSIDAEVINIHTIKPLDHEAILQSVKKTGKCIVLEEHQKIGGLGATVAQVLGEHFPVPMKFVSINDSFGQSGTAEELFVSYGLTWEKIIEAYQSFK